MILHHLTSLRVEMKHSELPPLLISEGVRRSSCLPLQQELEAETHTSKTPRVLQEAVNHTALPHVL